MSSTTNSSVVFTAASFSWPDGRPVLDSVNAAFDTGRTGLTGANGVGKTTLLRLVAGTLCPSAGRVAVSGAVGYLPQQLTLRVDATVADLLGVRAPLDALRTIEGGGIDQALFDAMEGMWDVEARSAAVLDEAGLRHLDLERTIGSLSGGETILVALAGLRLADTPIVLLDEPTNNLDRDARTRLYETISGWKRTLVVVSHDVRLLDLMNDTAELREARLSVYGGGFSAFRAHIAQEQAAAEQSLRAAEQVLQTERRQRIEAETKLARRSRYAKTDHENKRKPKIVMNQRATEAQVSAGKLRGQMEDRAATAQQAVEDTADRVRRDIRIHVDLPDPDVPTGRRLAEFHQGDRSLLMRGPERLALTGANGVGKTRLLEKLIAGEADPIDPTRAVLHTTRIGYLPQRLDHLDEDASIIECVQQAAPALTSGALRSRLARFRFRGDSVERPIASLSGGERFRVALARLLLADPPNQLLILDEPTNNLDLASIDVLVDALDGYRGGLIVVSHDDDFLARLNITTWVAVTPAGFVVIDPLVRVKA